MDKEKEKIINKINKLLVEIPSIYVLYKLENYIKCVKNECIKNKCSKKEHL